MKNAICCLVFLIPSFVYSQSFLFDVELIKTLAEDGNARNQFWLGQMHYSGDRVLKDYKEAVKWYTKAAKQGHVDAQYHLGFLYYILEENNNAKYWMKKAYENGHEKAKKAYDDLDLWKY